MSIHARAYFSSALPSGATPRLQAVEAWAGAGRFAFQIGFRTLAPSRSSFFPVLTGSLVFPPFLLARTPLSRENSSAATPSAGLIPPLRRSQFFMTDLLVSSFLCVRLLAVLYFPAFLYSLLAGCPFYF